MTIGPPPSRSLAIEWPAPSTICHCRECTTVRSPIASTKRAGISGFSAAFHTGFHALAPIGVGIDHRHVAMRAVEIPHERHAGIAHRCPAAVAEQAEVAIGQPGDASLGPRKEAAGETPIR